MKGKYMVQQINLDERGGIDGLEFLCDPNHGRRIYIPGEVVEMDDAVNDIAGLVARGVVALYKGARLDRPAFCESCGERWVEAPGSVCGKCGKPFKGDAEDKTQEEDE